MKANKKIGVVAITLVLMLLAPKVHALGGAKDTFYIGLNYSF